MMPLNIPMPEMPFAKFPENVARGSGLLNQLLAQRQQAQQFQQEHALDPMRKQLLEGQIQKQNLENNPQEFLRRKLSMVDYLTPEQIEALGGKDNLLKMITMNALGFKNGGLTAEQKRVQTLEDKIALEQEKAKLRQSTEKSKLDMRELKHIETDLPKLESAFKAASAIYDITNKAPEIFGYKLFPSTQEKLRSNPAFGELATNVGQVVGIAESELSSKGNILALKTALQFKPSHNEHVNVAREKAKSMALKSLERLKYSYEKLGKEMPEQIKTLSDKYLDKKEGNNSKILKYNPNTGRLE